MDRFLRIFAVLILVWVSTPVVAADDDDRGRGTVPPPPPPPPPPAASNPRPKDGAYNLTIAGFIKNNGSSVGSTVSGDTVDLQCDIVSAQNGQAGKLSVTGMKLTNGNYFSGQGTVLGQSAEFKGRLDFPDSAKERTIKGVRLVCTVKSADGKYARVIGYIPALAAAKDNVDSENDADRSRAKPVHRGAD